MCQDCDNFNPRAETTNSIAWAVPVDIVRFGAHLEAYVEVKPAIDTLRLCHRFGAGPKAHITKLPLELIAMIEETMQAVGRMRLLEIWKLEYGCFQGSCALEDHFTEEDIEGFTRRAKTIRHCMCYGDGEVCEKVRCDCANQPDSDIDSDDDEEQIEIIVRDLMAEDDSRFDLHYDNTWAWERRISKMICSDHNPTPIKNCLKVLKSDFGLSALISHQRINRADTPLLPYELYGYHDEAPKTTVCYLTLPDTALGDKSYNDDLWCAENESIEGLNVMSTVIDRSTFNITEDQRSRFGRTMTILDLKPHFHFTQVRSNVPTNISSEEKKEIPDASMLCTHHQRIAHEHLRDDMAQRVKKLEQSKWPKLMSLVTSKFTMSM